MEFIPFEENIKMNFDKKGKTLTKSDGYIEEYDFDGRLIKSYQMKNDLLNGKYFQKSFVDGKVNFLLKTNYLNGKLNGQFEVYKYSDNTLYYSEKSFYIDGLQEGSENIKQTFGATNIASFYFYKAGKKHGPFRLVTENHVMEGNCRNDKEDGFVTITSISDSVSRLLFYSNGEMVSL